MEDLKKILKSVLKSSPARLQAYQLNQDFKLYVGRNIPFEEYGYKSLLDFLHSKSMSDVLEVQGNDLFSPVKLNVPYDRIIRPKRRRRRRRALKKENMAELEKMNEMNISHEPGTSKLNPNAPCYPGININIHIDERRVNVFQKTQEPQSRVEIYKKEKQELRYPKTVFTLEKNGEKFDVTPIKAIQTGSGTAIRLEKTSMFKGEVEKSTIFEYIKNRPNLKRRLMHLPGKKTMTPLSTDTPIRTEKLVDLGDESTSLKHPLIPTSLPVAMSTPASILDEPVPQFVPNVAKQFVKEKSDDLIDFNGFVQIPTLSPVTVPPAKTVPFLEVIRLLKNLEISNM